jgi:phage-related protein
MATALPLTSQINQSSSSTTSFRTLKCQFGNGYEQRTPDGINDAFQRWTISYSPLDSTDRSTIWTFLNTVKGTGVISWTPPGGTAMNFVLDGDVRETVLSGDAYAISFTIKQVFDL